MLVFAHIYRTCRLAWLKHKLLTAAVVVILGTGIFQAIRSDSWLRLTSLWHQYPDRIIGLTALIFSIVGIFGIELLRQRASTKFIGEFPEHLDKIAKAIRGAGVRIDSLADCVDYGSFFRPEAFNKLFREVVEARDERKVQVRMLVCGPAQAISAASAWSSKKEFSVRIADPEFRDVLGHYLDVIRSDDTDFQEDFLPQYLDSRDETDRKVKGYQNVSEFCGSDGLVFERLVLLRHEWFVRGLSRPGVKVRHHSDRTDVFIWIIDGAEAVFLFAYPGADALAFSTLDSGLIRVLKNIFEIRWRDSKPYPHIPRSQISSSTGPV